MPKKIYFIRHAKAFTREEWNAKGKRDFTRPLKKKGASEFEHFCLKLPILRKIEMTYSSEFQRALETAKIIERVYRIPVVTDPLINHGEGPQRILEFLESRKEDTIAYTGHEPEISIMLNLLIRSDFQLRVKKGSVIITDFTEGVPIIEAVIHPGMILAGPK